MLDKIKNTIKTLTAAALTACMATACDNGAIYQQTHEMAQQQWDKNEVVYFDYYATDTVSLYDIVVDLRSTDEYAYQNFWLFCNSYSPNKGVYRDTLECVLADNDGRWIGDGRGSIHHLPVSYMHRVKFPVAGKYRFELIQGMRQNTLKGIADVGIRIMKSENQSGD